MSDQHNWSGDCECSQCLKAHVDVLRARARQELAASAIRQMVINSNPCRAEFPNPKARLFSPNLHKWSR